jgi:hypothetical protein
VSAVRIDHDEVLSSRAAQAQAFARELEQRAAVTLFERGELSAGEANLSLLTEAVAAPV